MALSFVGCAKSRAKPSAHTRTTSAIPGRSRGQALRTRYLFEGSTAWAKLRPRLPARKHFGPRFCTPSGAVLAAMLSLTSQFARAEPVAEFYQGKVITLTVASSAGGEYDTLARTLARFLGNHVPGHPLAIVRDMAGGGGIAAANFLSGSAARDGTAIGLLQNTTALAPLFGARDARYDPLKFAWLGTPNIDTGLFAVWHTVRVNFLAEAKEREISVGASG